MHTPTPPAAGPDAHWEWQYLALMRRIREEGDERPDRTGVGTRALFGTMLRFDLAGGRVPLLTTKRVYWKAAAREMLWFLAGETNIRPLLEQGVTIWSDWPLARYRRETGEVIGQEAFEQRIVEDTTFAARWGDLGPVYGKQWVDWATYEPAGAGLYRRGSGIDQVARVIESLRADPCGRRHIIEGWNVAELDQMALPPCHKTYQFHVGGAGKPAGVAGFDEREFTGVGRSSDAESTGVEGSLDNESTGVKGSLDNESTGAEGSSKGESTGVGRLNCLLYQRSCDVALGLPFNLFGAALLTRMIAQQTGYAPGELVWMGGDTHLYLNHAELVAEQLAREPTGEPVLDIVRRPPSIFDYRFEDFAVRGYKPHGAIRAPVAV